MFVPSSNLWSNAIEGYIAYLSEYGCSFVECSELVLNIAALLDLNQYAPGAVYDFFTISQLKTIAYYFYSYTSFQFYDNYHLIDKFFRSLEFDSYVYNEG